MQVPPYLTLHTASNIYFEYMFDISPDYSKKLRDHYGVKPQLMDFIGHPEVCRKNINNWASYQTDDHMVEAVKLFSPGVGGSRGEKSRGRVLHDKNTPGENIFFIISKCYSHPLYYMQIKHRR